LLSNHWPAVIRGSYRTTPLTVLGSLEEQGSGAAGSSSFNEISNTIRQTRALAAFEHQTNVVGMIRESFGA
jgi:hypothetical protein